MQLFILYEAANGYCLFEKQEYDDTGAGLPKVQKAIDSLERFTKQVTIAAYQPFKTAEEALENIQSVAHNKVSSTLKSFLTTHLPATKSSKKQKFALGISDARLGQEIFAETGITASFNETTVELMRGIRMHFSKIIKSKSLIHT
jgi:nucleolar protein 56